MRASAGGSQSSRLDASDALRKFPKSFELYVNMVQAGVGGILDTILGRLSIYTLEDDVPMKRKIKGAMIYPITIIWSQVIVT